MFSGPGGASLGYKMAGFRVHASVEKVKDVAITYKSNHLDTNFVLNQDVRDVKVSDFEIDRVDAVIGSPPCESFSTAGPYTRKANDDRDYLYREIIRVALGLNAPMIIMENRPPAKVMI